MFRSFMCTWALSVAAALAGSLPPGAVAQEKTFLEPLFPSPQVIRRPAAEQPAKHKLGLSVSFTDSGEMAIRNVHDNSPLKNMRRAGSLDVFEAEPGDIVVGIKDGRGRFIAPSSQHALAAILNSLESPRTQVLVSDVRGTGNWIFTIGFGVPPSAKREPSGARPPGGKVVVVLIGDTLDKSVGASVEANMQRFGELFAEAPIQPLVRSVVTITGRQFNRQSVLNQINAASVEPNDTVLCFINCHGALDPTLGDYAGGHVFQLGSERLPRRQLREALTLKDAALTCLISEACSVREARLVDAHTVSSSETPNAEFKFRSLLLAPRGVVDLNSSAPGEYSWTNVFGPAFHNVLTTNPIQDKSLPRKFPPNRETTWSEFVGETREATNTRYGMLREATLANPRAPQDLKNRLGNQRTQTVAAFSLPN